jgi:hypothetical protein
VNDAAASDPCSADAADDTFRARPDGWIARDGTPKGYVPVIRGEG